MALARRLFFALWPSAAARTELLAAAATAMTASDGRPVAGDALHVTLVFIGAVEEARLAAVIDAADALRAADAPRRGPFALRFDTLEHWPRAQVLCATTSVPAPPAQELSEALRAALLARGFAPDLKPFRAHVTLKRKVRRVAALATMTPVRQEFCEFALVESRTESAGPIYSSLRSWVLYGSGPERQNP